MEEVTLDQEDLPLISTVTSHLPQEVTMTTNTTLVLTNIHLLLRPTRSPVEKDMDLLVVKCLVITMTTIIKGTREGLEVIPNPDSWMITMLTMITVEELGTLGLILGVVIEALLQTILLVLVLLHHLQLDIQVVGTMVTMVTKGLGMITILDPLQGTLEDLKEVIVTKEEIIHLMVHLVVAMVTNHPQDKHHHFQDELAMKDPHLTLEALLTALHPYPLPENLHHMISPMRTDSMVCHKQLLKDQDASLVSVQPNLMAHRTSCSLQIKVILVIMLKLVDMVVLLVLRVPLLVLKTEGLVVWVLI